MAAGSGALYRHFKSKDALFDVGIDRQLDWRHAMPDIRALFGGRGDLHAELADWIANWVPALAKDDCAVLAALGVNGILGARFATSFFHQPNARVPDDRYLTEWTALLATRIEALQ